MAIIKTRQPFDGVRNRVLFKRSVGYTDDPILIAWFKDHNYIVEEQDTKTVKDTEIIKEKVVTKDEKPSEYHKMTKLELFRVCRDKKIQYSIGNSKEELIELIKKVTE